MANKPYPKLDKLTPEYVNEFPGTLEHRKLYISERYPVALHLCACGCGSKLAIDLMVWNMLVEEDDSVTVKLPLRNSSCQAQYAIIKNGVVWL